MPKHDTIEDYIAAHPAPLNAIIEHLRTLIDDVLPSSAVSSVFHAAPTWSVGPGRGTGLVCYVKAYSKYVTFGFWHGQEVTDASGRLQPGARQMAQVKLTSTADIDRDLFRDWLNQAWSLEKRHLAV